MVRTKIFLLPILCSLIFAQSCVHGDLDECPPMVRYAVAFEYTHHARTSNLSNGKDRFYDDVKKINLFVFDNNNLIYTTDTKIGPYDSNFNIPLDLPMGNYHIIAWGNVLALTDTLNTLATPEFVISPENFPKGTSLSQARLTLERGVNSMSQKDFENLFYGESKITIPLYVSRIDTIPLINDSKNVRVVLHWEHAGLDGPITYNDVEVHLHGTNAVYNFLNTPETTTPVTYLPYKPFGKGASLHADTWTNVIPALMTPTDNRTLMDTTVYDFRVLRMIPGHLLKLCVYRHNVITPTDNLLATLGTPERSDPNYGIDIVGSISADRGFSYFMRSSNGLSLTTQAQMQSAYDMYDNYQVDIHLLYDRFSNTYIAQNINILDWLRIQGNYPGWAN